MDSSCRNSSSLEFFKVFLPSSSSQRLSIPPAFVKHFNGRIPSKAVLRDHCGKSWHVTLEELKNRVFFKNGWQEFADDHFLEHADFLVFQYDGSHMFDVKIFGKNGCKKKLASGTSSLFPAVRIKDEPQSEQDYSKSSSRCKRSDSEVRSNGSSETAPKSRRISATIYEELSAGKTADQNSTALPIFFEHTVRRWSHTSIHISKTVLITNNIMLKPNVVLIDEEGRSWPVTVRAMSRSRNAITSGWPIFFKENGLRVDDKCTFEFVIGPNNICGELNVKITRNLAETQHEE